jgi:hypothetical protein
MNGILHVANLFLDADDRAARRPPMRRYGVESIKSSFGSNQSLFVPRSASGAFELLIRAASASTPPPSAARAMARH